MRETFNKEEKSTTSKSANERITEIQAYMTTDGDIFADKDAAIDREKELRFKDELNRILMYSDCSNEEETFDLIMENAHALYKTLHEYIGDEYVLLGSSFK